MPLKATATKIGASMSTAPGVGTSVNVKFYLGCGDARGMGGGV